MSKIDLSAGKVIQTVNFPAGSTPWMLRVSPDGREVWVQTGTSNANVVLDVDTMAVLHTIPAGRQPVEAAFQPGGGPYGIVTHLAESFVLVIDRQTGAEVARIDVGGSQANASFTPDGALVFISVSSRDAVVAIDMATLAPVALIPTGRQPMGLVLLDPRTP